MYRMAFKLENIVEVPLQGGFSKCAPIFIENKIIKVGIDGIRISLIHNSKSPKNATLLLGHEKPISTMSIAPDYSVLCSCSEDRIILWDIESFRHTTKDVFSAPSHSGLIIGENIGCVLHCSISWTQKWLALCRLKEVWIVLLKKNMFILEENDGFSLYTVLKTDSNVVNMCSFSSVFLDIMVTIEDSNHFQVWDLLSSNVLYHSTHLVNNSITCCSFGGVPTKLLIGTSKGVAHIYSFNEKKMPSFCMNFNISERSFMVEAEKGITDAKVKDHVKQEDIFQVKKGCIILSLNLYQDFSSSETRENHSSNGELQIADNMLASIVSLGSILVTCCNLGIIMHNCKSCECIGRVLFSEIKIGKFLEPVQFSLIDHVVLIGKTINDLQCWIKTPFSQQKLYNLKLVFEKSEGSLPDHFSEKNGGFNQCLSFLPRQISISEPSTFSSTINEKSPLLKDLSFDERSIYAMKNVINYKKTKSSGYRAIPRTNMFVPVTNESIKKKNPTKANKSLTIYHSQHCGDRRNVLHYGPPEDNDIDLLICKTNGTFIKLAYSVYGCHIACNYISSDLCIIPTNPMQMDKSTIISGHDSSITSLSFNLSSKWVLSSSTDSTVNVWNWRNRKSILKIEVDEGSKPNTRCNNSVVQAGFFYLDKFIMLAKKDQIDMYAHSLLKDNTRIQGSPARNASQKIKSISFPTQQVTCFSAANQFHSYLIAGGCSNRDIMIYDLNHQRFAATLNGAHNQHPPHRLVQLTGSTCPSIPALSSGTYNLFLSTAISDGVKLWDLRTLKCIQKYNKHMNKVYSSGIDFSPCSRFVAVCSEDKRVYIYDTRDCENYLCRLGGFTDVAMDVAFSPCMTQLAASSLNGHILTFKPSYLL